MIKANELRVGNIFHTLIVKSITETGVNFSARYEGYLETPFEDLKPIPLTEDWLLKLGFEKYNDNYSIDTLHGLNSGKPSKLVIRYTELQNMVVVRPGNRTIYIKSVHQLQNLYFALTGEELEFKANPSSPYLMPYLL